MDPPNSVPFIQTETYSMILNSKIYIIHKLTLRQTCRHVRINLLPSIYLKLKFLIIRLASLFPSLSLISCLLSLTFFPLQSPIWNLTFLPPFFQYAFSGTIVIPGVRSVFCNNRRDSALCSSKSRGRRSSCWKNSPAVACLPMCMLWREQDRPFLSGFTNPSLMFILPSRILCLCVFNCVWFMVWYIVIFLCVTMMYDV